MEIAAAHGAARAAHVHGFALAPRAAGRGRGAAHGRQRRVAHRIVKAVAAQRRRVGRSRPGLHAQAGQLFLHGRATRQQAPHCVRGTVRRDQLFEQRHHAAAFGPDRLAVGGVPVQGAPQIRARGQRGGVQLGVAAGQPQRVAFGQRIARQRREEHHARAQRLQRGHVGRVDEGKSRIARHGYGAAGEQRRHGVGIAGGGRGKRHGPARAPVVQRQRAQRRGGQQVGGGVQPRQRGILAQFVRGHQAQVPLGQLHGGAARQVAEPALGRIDRTLQQRRVPGAGHAVCQHAGPGQAPVAILFVVAQAMHDGAQRLRHGAGLHHGQHRQAEAARQVGRAGRAVVQAHHAFDQQHISLASRGVQARADVGLAGHPQVDVVHRRAAGKLVPERVQKVRPALEHPHAPAAPRQHARQRGCDGGLALAGGRSGDQESGAIGHGARLKNTT